MAKEKSAKFTLEMEDKTSGAANNAAQALERLKGKIEADTAALRQMQKAQRVLNGGGKRFSKQAKELKTRIDAQKASIAATQNRWMKLGGSFTTSAKKGEATKSALESLTGKLSEAGGGAATLGSRLSSMGALLANPIAAVMALTAATLALTAATVAAVGALLRYGLAQSGARRAEALRLEGMNSLRAQYGRVTDSIESMQSAIDRASDATGLGRPQLEGYARSLTRVGFRGEALAQALEGTALAASVQGERGASRFRAMAINASAAGRSVRELTEDYRARLGPIALRQMLSLDNQSRRLQMSLDRIFSGLRIESFLGAISEITDQFSQTTESGRALKDLVEAIFQPMFDASEGLGPIFRRFFQGMVIGALGLGIAFLEVRNAIRDTFGDSTLLGDIDALDVALGAGILTVSALAIALGTLVVAIGMVATSLAFIAGIPALIAVGFASLLHRANQLGSWFMDTDFAQWAGSMIDGLVNGLRNGASRLAQQVRVLAAGLSDSFTNALGISSPSRVFAGYGLNIAQGVTRGIESGEEQASAAASNLVQEPAGGGVRSSVSVSIGDVNIQAGETSEPRELAEQFRDQLAMVLDGLSVEMGAT